MCIGNLSPHITRSPAPLYMDNSERCFEGLLMHYTLIALPTCLINGDAWLPPFPTTIVEHSRSLSIALEAFMFVAVK